MFISYLKVKREQLSNSKNLPCAKSVPRDNFDPPEVRFFSRTAIKEFSQKHPILLVVWSITQPLIVFFLNNIRSSLSPSLQREGDGG